MEPAGGEDNRHLGWWTTIFVALVIALIVLAAAQFNRSFRSFVPVTVISERSGLVLEPGSKVRLRGVQVGRVGSAIGGSNPVALRLEIDPDQVKNIPDNVEAQINASTVFGAKYVDLIYPDQPNATHITAGAVLRSRNVSTEINTVFENLVLVLEQVDPAKLNATVTALAAGVRGQGEAIGQAITDANQVLLELNPRMGTVQQDIRSLSGFSAAYSNAAQDLLQTLSALSTTSTTITSQTAALDALLLNAIGLSRSATDLLETSQRNLIGAINVLESTTNLLGKYNPTYTCLLLGATWFLDNGGRDAFGGADGKSWIVDSTLLLGDDDYKYPENLPVVAAQGGPGGKPSCGSLPDVSKRYPVRQMVTDAGWGTGLDIRPNPGIGHPFYSNYFPVTRALPEPPSIRGDGPPAIGPVPYPGAPAYGAPLYGPDATPLYPPPPGPPPAAQPPSESPDVAGVQP